MIFFAVELEERFFHFTYEIEYTHIQLSHRRVGCAAECLRAYTFILSDRKFGISISTEIARNKGSLVIDVDKQLTTTSVKKEWLKHIQWS